MDLSKLKKAESLLNSRRFGEAEQYLIRFIKKNPHVAQAYLMLASVYGETGRFEDVAKTCKKVIGTHPQHPMAHSLMGSACVLLGRANEAIEHLQTANKLLPGDPGIMTNLGNALYATGAIEEAMSNYLSALQIIPDYPQANFGLGNCNLALGKWNDAVIRYRKAYDSMADNYDVNMSLGKAYMNLGNLDEAVNCYQRAMKLNVQPAVVLCELAMVNQLQGHLDKALDYVEQSLKLQPDSINARAIRAEIYYKLGDIDAAYKEVYGLVNEGRFNAKALDVYSNLCQHFNECNDVISLCHSFITNNQLSRTDTAILHYSLGKLYDKNNDYEAAFKHYDQANKVFPGDFNHENHHNVITGLISGYSKNNVQTLPRSGCTDGRPVFIVGMPRSGTSLVEQILSSHPDVYGAGELGDIQELARRIITDKGSNNSTCFRSIETQLIDDLANQYILKLNKLAGSEKRITDKMPGNYMWLGVIMQLFPKARVIHCQRDPRDTCLSIFFQQFTKGHNYANDLNDLAFYYRQYERLMSHWREVLDIPMIEINYADLAVDLDGHARRLVEFLGLAWDDRCLSFYKSRRATATASWDQVRQPIYTKSIGRWKNYKSHLGPLLAEFGYDDLPSSCSNSKRQLNSA